MERRKNVLLVAGAVLVAFVAGFGWQFARAERLDRELAETQRRLEMQRLENTLAAATIAAHRGTYEIARQLASDFYTRLEATTADDASTAEEFAALRGQRDATITMLSRADPRSAEILDRQFIRLRVAIGGPERALPIAGPEQAAPGPAADSPRGTGATPR